MEPDPALVSRVRARLAADRSVQLDAAHVAAAVRAEGKLLGEGVLAEVVSEIRLEISGAGSLQPLLDEPGVTDVLVNGPDQVFVDRGEGLRPAAVRFRDEAAVRRLAQRLAALSGRRLDDAAPWVDACLPGGVRLHAVLPPIAGDGTCLSLRVPPRKSFTLDDLLAAGSLTSAGADLLLRLVRSRVAFLVSGGTGTGKTTVLSTLLGLVDPGERMVLVEDSPELRPAHPHVVRLETRPPNVEGKGTVTLRDLVRQALRMRPDRIVVGEVRGGEVVELLSALNTGHEGGSCTVHANAAADVPARLEALGLVAGLERAAVHSLLGSGLAVILHLARPGGLRRLAEIAVPVAGADGRVRVVPAVTFGADGSGHDGPGRARLEQLLGSGSC